MVSQILQLTPHRYWFHCSPPPKLRVRVSGPYNLEYHFERGVTF